VGDSIVTKTTSLQDDYEFIFFSSVGNNSFGNISVKVKVEVAEIAEAILLTFAERKLLSANH